MLTYIIKTRLGYLTEEGSYSGNNEDAIEYEDQDTALEVAKQEDDGEVVEVEYQDPGEGEWDEDEDQDSDDYDDDVAYDSPAHNNPAHNGDSEVDQVLRQLRQARSGLKSAWNKQCKYLSQMI